MAKEIERKYLVDLNKLNLMKDGVKIKQGYIPTVDNTVVRVRLKGQKAFLTIKGEVVGFSCSEFEYEIPLLDAENMINELCGSRIVDKTRYNIMFADKLWEIDIFHGANEGLIVAEIELASEDEIIELPPWVTDEVTGQVEYYNVSLLDRPYSKW